MHEQITLNPYLLVSLVMLGTSLIWSLAFVIGAWWGAAPRDRTERRADCCSSRGGA